MSSSSQEPSSGYILETCQPCVSLKIRCLKTQDSGLCDRCLRLGKTCVFGPARRRPKVSRKRQEDRLETRSRSRRRSTSPSSLETSTSTLALNPERLGDIFNSKASLDPFERKILSLETGQMLIEHYGKIMTPYFPFVLFPKKVAVIELNATRPCACLAALAVASHADTHLQRALFSLFNDMVALRMARGQFHNMDMLQGLLISLAWAHYQPRPKKYTQILHLATSIISDVRLDRPRRPKLWAVDGGKDRNEPDWGSDEMRALIGAYYLSSLSSIMLQKLHHFPHTPYISKCCENLALLSEHQTDRYLVFIVQLQVISEEIEAAVRRAGPTNDVAQFSAETQEIARKYSEIKSTMLFPLNESPLLLLQLNMLELLLTQSSPQGTSFGLDRFENNQDLSKDQTSFIGWLSASMSAVNSLITVVLALPTGELVALSNLGWVMMYCALSLAVRLDLLSATGSISGLSQYTRQFMDVPHIIQQTILRLESIAATNTRDGVEDSHPFQDLVKRVRWLQEWHSTQVDRQTAASNGMGNLHLTEEVMLTMNAEIVALAPSWPYQNAWAENPTGYHDSEIILDNLLFADPIGLQGDFYDQWFIGTSSSLENDV